MLMKDFSDLKQENNLKTGQVVLNSVFIPYFYPNIWISRYESLFTSKFGREITNKNILFALNVSLAWYITSSFFIVSVIDDHPRLGFLFLFMSTLLNLTWFGLLIYWSFKARSAIMEMVQSKCGIDYEMST